MSSFSNENDSDDETEYVSDFNMIDLSDFRLVKGDELAGGSWETCIEHILDENISLQFALPPIKLDGGLDIQRASKNGFFRIKLDENQEK